jgi:hypothetical protein
MNRYSERGILRQTRDESGEDWQLDYRSSRHEVRARIDDGSTVDIRSLHCSGMSEGCRTC